jgi:hypothetical protein
MTRPKGTCPVCKKTVVLRIDGRLRGHGGGRYETLKPWCAGSLEFPEEPKS